VVCPICRGKSEVGVFCSDCYLKRNLKIEVPSVIEVPYCKRCGSAQLKGRWVKGLTEDEVLMRTAEDSVKSNIKRLEKAGILKLDIEKSEMGHILKVSIVLGDAVVTKTAIMRLKSTTCQQCCHQSGGYCEAIIQLRGNVKQEHIDKILEAVSGHKDTFAFVGQVKKIREGYDIHLGSKKSAEKAVKLFAGRAEAKKSFTLTGYDRHAGKTKCRFSYLLRF
jgi:NMD protein affecting ribosome stability and mRNA decay